MGYLNSTTKRTSRQFQYHYCYKNVSDEAATTSHVCWFSVDTSDLPPVLAARHCYVHARLLQNCGEFAKALDSARDALQGVTVSAAVRVTSPEISYLSSVHVFLPYLLVLIS